jgi:hypothetical protein
VTLWSTLPPCQLLPSCLPFPSQFAPNTLKHKQKLAVPAGALLSSLNDGQFRNMMVQGCTSSTFNDNIPNHTTTSTPSPSVANYMSLTPTAWSTDACLIVAYPTATFFDTDILIILAS